MGDFYEYIVKTKADPSTHLRNFLLFLESTTGANTHSWVKLELFPHSLTATQQERMVAEWVGLTGMKCKETNLVLLHQFKRAAFSTTLVFFVIMRHV